MRSRSMKVLITVLVLLAAAVPASAGTKGSKSDSATAAWLADGSAHYCDGVKPVYMDGSSISRDNQIDGWVYVWVLSSNAVYTEDITWVAQTGDSGATYYGDLDYTGSSCGRYQLMSIDMYNDGGNDGNYLQAELSDSWSLKFDYAGKNFSADSARFA